MRRLLMYWLHGWIQIHIDLLCNHIRNVKIPHTPMVCDGLKRHTYGFITEADI